MHTLKGLAMLTRDFAETFARSWVQAWNDRDIEAVANHYTDDIIYHSPKLSKIIEHDAPIIKGKTALIEYWNAAIEGARSLYFDVHKIFVSSDAVTLLFINHQGQEVAETFVFNEDLKIKECIAAYF